jgi:ankyrin repeat protein
MNFLDPNEQQPIDVQGKDIIYALKTGNNVYDEFIEHSLIQNPGLLLYRDDYGSSCLEIAIEKNIPSFVQFITSEEFLGAINPNSEDRMSASSIVNEILNNTDKNGNSCLHIAAKENRPEILEILIIRYARFNMHSLENLYSFVNNENKNGSSPLLLALKNDNLEVASRLIHYDANANDILMDAVSRGKINLVQKLITTGANLNFRDEMENTPLSIARKNGHLEIAELLAKNGATMNGGKKRNNKSKKRNNKSKKKNYKKRKTFKKFHNV